MGKKLGISPGRFLWIFIILGSTIRVAPNKKLFVNAISQWDNKVLVWENVTYIHEKVFVNFHNPGVYHLGAYHILNYLWLQFLNERIKCWYEKMLGISMRRFLWILWLPYKKLFVNAISQWDNKMLVWEKVRYIPGKVFVNFHNPRVYH